MTPKEKVLNLIENSYDIIPDDGTILLLGKDKAFEIAKKCALIAVDEILTADMFMMTEEQEKYWEQVKQELEKL
jgi:hypothetical protein